MEILTGGNPRLLAILATFASERPLQELMDHLAELIADHTPFLKSNIDALPSQERRVFVNLAKLWEPSTARRVGERSRLNSNTASAVLKSLVNRGVVVERGKEGRGKLYQVAERIYCIYYLLRLSGSEADRMRALVRFMVHLYGEDRLARSPAEAACSSDGRGRFIEGYRGLLSQNPPEGMQQRVLAGRWDEAFDQMEPWIDDEAFVEMHLDDMLVLIIDAAADGQAERALRELSGTVAERAMEPLVVALKELAGEKCRAPQEVEEVKKDVLATIEERRQALSELRARFRDS